MNLGSQKNLNVAAAGAGFNLAAALANLANPAGAVVGYTRDLLRWLERSGLDEANLKRCMTEAQGLASPNKNGMILFGSVAKADARLKRLNKGQLPLELTFPERSADTS